MTCEKCCLWPCDRTNRCPEGTYWVRNKHDKLIRMIELSKPTQVIIGRAVIKALEMEV